jgi:osmotically inducible protein OsmC
MRIDLVDGTIITSHLTVDAKVKDITDDAFQNWTKAEKTVPFLKY